MTSATKKAPRKPLSARDVPHLSCVDLDDRPVVLSRLLVVEADLSAGFPTPLSARQCARIGALLTRCLVPQARVRRHMAAAGRRWAVSNAFLLEGMVGEHVPQHEFARVAGFLAGRMPTSDEVEGAPLDAVAVLDTPWHDVSALGALDWLVTDDRLVLPVFEVIYEQDVYGMMSPDEDGDGVLALDEADDRAYDQLCAALARALGVEGDDVAGVSLITFEALMAQQEEDEDDEDDEDGGSDFEHFMAMIGAGQPDFVRKLRAHPIAKPFDAPDTAEGIRQGFDRLRDEAAASGRTKVVFMEDVAIAVTPQRSAHVGFYTMDELAGGVPSGICAPRDEAAAVASFWTKWFAERYLALIGGLSDLCGPMGAFSLPEFVRRLEGPQGDRAALPVIEHVHVERSDHGRDGSAGRAAQMMAYRCLVPFKPLLDPEERARHQGKSERTGGHGDHGEHGEHRCPDCMPLVPTCTVALLMDAANRGVEQVNFYATTPMGMESLVQYVQQYAKQAGVPIREGFAEPVLCPEHRALSCKPIDASEIRQPRAAQETSPARH